MFLCVCPVFFVTGCGHRSENPAKRAEAIKTNNIEVQVSASGRTPADIAAKTIENFQKGDMIALSKNARVWSEDDTNNLTPIVLGAIAAYETSDISNLRQTRNTLLQSKEDVTKCLSALGQSPRVRHWQRFLRANMLGLGNNINNQDRQQAGVLLLQFSQPTNDIRTKIFRQVLNASISQGGNGSIVSHTVSSKMAGLQLQSKLIGGVWEMVAVPNQGTVRATLTSIVGTNNYIANVDGIAWNQPLTMWREGIPPLKVTNGIMILTFKTYDSMCRGGFIDRSKCRICPIDIFGYYILLQIESDSHNVLLIPSTWCAHN